ncbi:MAG: biotin--[acetyl-CoA-carboxylase] ligase [Zetaproteobacteria bacterium CG2_30_46_52]|nr:MAG: biotin--[acetyl-CoA-carboxylase] ligase [Zetaproteobacteria bacterium CG2_30_46_52]
MLIHFNIQHFDSLDSSNKEALRQAEAGANEGEVIVAKRQTAGKGRLGRTWHTLEHALAFSVLLRPKLKIEQLSQLSLLTAVALQETLAMYNPHIGIKWPNDLLVQGQKISGILTEMRCTKGAPPTVVLGIGINISKPKQGWPEDINQPVTDLESVSNHKVDSNKVLNTFLQSLNRWLDILYDQGFAPVRNAWWRAHVASQAMVRVYDGQGYIEGLAIGLAEDGALRLLVNGAEQRIIAGDVTVMES